LHVEGGHTMQWQRFVVQNLELFLATFLLGMGSVILFILGLRAERFVSALILLSLIGLAVGAGQVHKLMSGKQRILWVEGIYILGFAGTAYFTYAMSSPNGIGTLGAGIFLFCASFMVVWMTSCAAHDCQHLTKKAH
jgi:hypothetical protein